MSKILLNFISGIKGGGVEQYLQNNTPAIKRAGITSYVVYQHTPDAQSLDAWSIVVVYASEFLKKKVIL